MTSEAARGLDQTLTVAHFELKRFRSSLRIGGMVGVILVLVGVVLALPTALGDPYASSLSLAQSFGSFVPLLSAALGLLFGADSLVAEFNAKTGHILLPNPVSRSTIVVGKFTAAVLASWLALILYYALTFVTSLAIFGEAAFDIIPSFAYALLYTIAALAFIFLISSVSPSVTSSVTAAFLILVVFFPWAGPQLRTADPWNLVILTEAGSIAHRLLNLQRSIPRNALFNALVTVGLYSVVSLAVAGIAFEYREN